MKLLELFAGMQCFSEVARRRGHETFTSDWLQLKGIDYPVSIADFDIKKLPFMPDLVWASPECKAFSSASGGYHFKREHTIHTYRTKNGKLDICKKNKDWTLKNGAQAGIEMVNNMMRVLNELLELNPNLLFYIENPVGLIDKVTDMQANSFLSPLHIPRRVKIDQCAYGRDVKKPTYIFTNDMKFEGLKCIGEECTHLRARYREAENRNRIRVGSLNKGYYASAAIPERLSISVLMSAERQLKCKTP